MARQKTDFTVHPPIEILKWLDKYPEYIAGDISGRSLKFLYAGISTLIFHAHSDAFELYREKIRSLPSSSDASKEKADEPVCRVTKMDENEVRLYAQLQNYGGEFRIVVCRVNSPDVFDLRSKDIASLRISIDRLRYDVMQKCWIGDSDAMDDLEKCRIRTIEHIEAPSAAQSLQACALSAMLDFDLDIDFMNRCRLSFDESEATSLPAYFLGKQLKRMVSGARPSKGILNLDGIGALDWFLPELARGRGLSQNRYHKYDIFYHSIYACDAAPSGNLKIRLAALFHDLGKVDTRKLKPDGEASFHNHELFSYRHANAIMRRYNIDRRTASQVKFLVRNHMFHYTSEWSDRAIRRFSKKVGPEAMEDLISLRLADREGSGKRTKLPRAIQDLMRHIDEVRAQEAELKVRDLELDGHGLKQLGMQAGPEMGRCLGYLLEEVKAERLPNESEALRTAAILWMKENPAARIANSAQTVVRAGSEEGGN